MLIIIVLLLAISGIVLCYFQGKKETSPAPSISKEENKKEVPNENETPIPPEEKWLTYTNDELGFSIKYPEMVYGVSRCESKKQFYVPLKVFEDKENGIVYITEEYYYDAPYDGELNKFTGPCEKIINSMESLNEQMTIDDKIDFTKNPFLTKVFVIKNIENDTEINKFIKDNYGSECIAESRNFWKQQTGVYEIKLNEFKDANGNDTDLGNAICPVNYVYKILYAPEKNKIMSIKLGQECSFTTDYNAENYKCYDEEMIDSFEFK